MNRLIALAIVIAAAGMNPAGAQTTDASRLFFDAVAFSGAGDAMRLDLFLAVPFAGLSFERSGSSFAATYRVHFQIDSGSRRIFDTTFERTVSTRSAEIAAAHRATYDFFQRPVPIAPGSYEARAEIIDARTTFVMGARRSVNVVDYASSAFALSGLLLVERIREDSSGYVITPRLSDAVGERDYFVFFEAYNGGVELDVRLGVRYGGGGAETPTRSFTRTIPSGRTQHWLRLDAIDVAPGAYTLVVDASAVTDSTRLLASTQRSIRVESATAAAPASEAELDERIAQLRYIALQSEIDAIRDAGSPADRRKRYSEFWMRHDPTPGTADNEALVEYFARIDYAQEKYRSYSPGWMTDQGRIYVIYGPPDNILRDPFQTDGRRTETWQYFSRGNISVVFQDDSGFGDFRLVTPISHLEKYRYGE